VSVCRQTEELECQRRARFLLRLNVCPPVARRKNWNASVSRTLFLFLQCVSAWRQAEEMKCQHKPSIILLLQCVSACGQTERLGYQHRNKHLLRYNVCPPGDRRKSWNASISPALFYYYNVCPPVARQKSTSEKPTELSLSINKVCQKGVQTSTYLFSFAFLLAYISVPSPPNAVGQTQKGKEPQTAG
jgi:hypothetical protein